VVQLGRSGEAGVCAELKHQSIAVQSWKGAQEIRMHWAGHFRKGANKQNGMDYRDLRVRNLTSLSGILEFETKGVLGSG